LAAEAVASLCSGEGHAPLALAEAERAGLERALPEGTPDHVRADIPAWLWPSFERGFGDEAAAEGVALARRGPIDLRVNTLKATRDKVLVALEPFGAVATPYSPVGIRLSPPAAGGRSPNVQAEPAFQKGWFEVQDEASQIAALLAAAAAGAGAQVLDLCAGGGGKTLALAAALANKGQIFAHDTDRLRLAPIHERLQRAAVRNVQVLPTRGEPLKALESRMDCVLIDAPCTGTGVWRRRPDAKWRLTPEALARRIEEQRAILLEALAVLKPGGRLVYVTCSLLPEENADQVGWLLAQRPNLKELPAGGLLEAALGASLPPIRPNEAHGVTLRPSKTNTDGFFIAVLKAA
jgi:16S rRNA (cytosine967-C5)-methyltransferase